MSGLLRGWLAGDKDKNGTSPADFSQQLLAFSNDPTIQIVIAEALERETTPVSERIRLLEVMAAAPVGTWPAPWVDALKKALGDRDERVVRQAVSVVLATNRTEYDNLLVGLTRDPTRGKDVRVEAAEAIAPRLHQVDASLFEILLARLELEEPPLRRMSAARALGGARLGDDQLLELAHVIGEAGALMLPRLLPTFERARNPTSRGRGWWRPSARRPGVPQPDPGGSEAYFTRLLR